MPKDETAERRGLPVSGQGTACWSRDTAPVDQSTWVVGSSRWRLLGTVPRRIARTILMIPETPAAAWE